MRFGESRRSRDRMTLDHQLGGQLLVGRVDERPGVARREEVGAGVVREEELGRVEPGGRGERAARGTARVVRQMRGVSLVAHDRVVPAGRGAHRRQHEQALQLAERHGLVLRAIGQRAVGNLAAEREAPRAPAVQRCQQREARQPIERLAHRVGRCGFVGHLSPPRRPPSRCASARDPSPRRRRPRAACGRDATRARR